MPPFKRYFPRQDWPTLKLLSWCISSTVPLHYMSGVLATTVQQDEDVPTTTTASEGSQAQGPSSSPAYTHRTPPLPVHPLPDIPFVGLPHWGAHLLSSLLSPHRKVGATLPAAHSMITATRGPVLTLKRSRLGVNILLYRVTRTCWNRYQKLSPALNSNKSRNLPAPFQSTRAITDPHDGTVMWTQPLKTASHAQTQMK